MLETTSCMKIILPLLFLPVFGFAQQVNKNADTITYDHHKYFVGKNVQLDYGSSDSKNFGFVFWGLYDEPANPVDAKWANTILEVEKIYTLANRVYLKCHTKMVRNNFHIDHKDAIDHHEIKF